MKMPTKGENNNNIEILRNISQFYFQLVFIKFKKLTRTNLIFMCGILVHDQCICTRK